jgi:hypothetical protein
MIVVRIHSVYADTLYRSCFISQDLTNVFYVLIDIFKKLKYVILRHLIKAFIVIPACKTHYTIPVYTNSS